MESTPTHFTYIELAIKILKEQNNPMTIKELTEKISKMKSIHTQTPNKSICLALNRSNQITKVSKGKYALITN